MGSRAQGQDAALVDVDSSHSIPRHSVMTNKLYAVRIFSLHWDESLAFYRDLIGSPVKFSDETMGGAQFSLGNADLGLERVTADDPETAQLVGRFAGVSIEVDALDASFEDLKSRGVPFTAPPAQQPWGGSLAHFQDPDGNTHTRLGSS
jgi:predicted enzyme related to lactoylglutathione lyase